MSALVIARTAGDAARRVALLSARTDIRAASRPIPQEAS